MLYNSSYDIRFGETHLAYYGTFAEHSDHQFIILSVSRCVLLFLGIVSCLQLYNLECHEFLRRLLGFRKPVIMTQVILDLSTTGDRLLGTFSSVSVV